ncbi:MAG: RNA-directed DNA polymerase [bacterium]|nr:RNA-directed DNA polymerase [bacterium]
MGISINLTLSNVWRSWKFWQHGKKSTKEIGIFKYNLEENLFRLWKDLNSDNYTHGDYRKYAVYENKRRDIAVAPIRDRILHRLLYDYLVSIYDSSFIFDVWSCRRGKGLLAGIERSQKFLTSFPHGFVWKSDIKKFFDSVNQAVLLKILSGKIRDKNAIKILGCVIHSFELSNLETKKGYDLKKGIPIGNLTSQIFSNIYLNEFDCFVVQTLKPNRYLRYGDDFILIDEDKNRLKNMRHNASKYLKEALKLEINKKNDILCKTIAGINFLGCKIYPGGRKIKPMIVTKSFQNLKYANFSSYWGLFKHHGGRKPIERFQWQMLDIVEDIF